MKVRIDADVCTGCGLCEDICPEVFELKDEGLVGVAAVIVDTMPEEFESVCREAMNICPDEAIVIVE